MLTRNFGRIIRNKRERKRMTIVRTAELAGLTHEGLSLIELGDSNPKLSSILSLAAVLEIDLGEINVCKPQEIKNKLPADQRDNT